MGIHQIAIHKWRRNLRHNWPGIFTLCCSFTSRSPFRKVAKEIRQLADHKRRQNLLHNKHCLITDTHGGRLVVLSADGFVR